MLCSYATKAFRSFNFHGKKNGQIVFFKNWIIIISELSALFAQINKFELAHATFAYRIGHNKKVYGAKIPSSHNSLRSEPLFLSFPSLYIRQWLWSIKIIQDIASHFDTRENSAEFEFFALRNSTRPLNFKSFQILLLTI